MTTRTLAQIDRDIARIRRAQADADPDAHDYYSETLDALLDARLEVMDVSHPET